MTHILNAFHSDNWKVSISSIPTCKPEEMYIFDNFIKSVNFPEYGLDTFDTFLSGYRDIQPIAHRLNPDLVLLQLEIKLCENIQNYTALFMMIQNLKYGQNITGQAKDYNIPTISVTFLDNNKRTIGMFNFTRCIPVNITALPLSFGSGEEITFQCNLVYNQILWVPTDIPECES